MRELIQLGDAYFFELGLNRKLCRAIQKAKASKELEEKYSKPIQAKNLSYQDQFQNLFQGYVT